nr:putative GTP-binding protein 6 isoform X2 [Rattus norvegicus]
MRRAVLPVCHCFTHPGARARAMLFPRVAALPGIWLLRVRRVQHALSLAGTLPRPVRAVSAGSRALGSVWASDGPVRGGGPEDPREDEEEEELLRVPPLLPFDAQRVCVLHPDVKRPAGKTPRSTAEWQVAEAAALVRALPGWSVARTLVVSSAAPGSRQVFGKGNFRDLTEKIRGCQDITSVFLNVERMTPQTQKELETAWGLRVFDRFTLVLHIFRCNARTREARMQLALAEIPLLRSSVSGDSEQQDQQGWGSRYIMGSGESFSELRARALRDRELRLRRVLERLRDKRRLMRKERVRREFPVVSVVGYTNCAAGPAIRNARRHGARGAAALAPSCPVRGHHWLLVPAAAQPDPRLLCHAGGCGLLGRPGARDRCEPSRRRTAESHGPVHTAGPGSAPCTAGVCRGGSQQGGPGAWAHHAMLWSPGGICSLRAWAGRAEGGPGGVSAARHRQAAAHDTRAPRGTPAWVALQ